jgi:hypothetical protein
MTASPRNALKDSKKFVLKDDERYQIRTKWISYEKGTLRYQGPRDTQDIILADWYLPAATAHPKVSALSEHSDYVDTLLAFLDAFIDATATGHPEPKEIRKLSSWFLRVLDWLRMHDVYRLSDATPEHLQQLATSVAYAGWRTSLNYDQRWADALKHLTKEEIRDGFHFSSTRSPKLAAIKSKFWSRTLGWGPEHSLYPEIRARVESYFGEGDKRWQQRKDHPSTPPTETVVRALLSDLNRLSHLPANVDRLSFRPFAKPSTMAREIAKSRTHATENMALEDMVTILKNVIFVLYEAAPLLIDVLEQVQESKARLSRNRFFDHVYERASTLRLGEIFGTQIQRLSQMGKKSEMLANGEQPGSVDMIIGQVQSACAIAIGALTAHRPGEVTDEINGLRVGDLISGSPGDAVAQLNIYFSKSLRNRHQIYICRMVMDAVLCLEKIKALCLPAANKKPAVGESLFVTFRPSQFITESPAYFEFIPQPNAVRSTTNFIRFCFRDEEYAPTFQPRMLRRFYATLYMHRYRNPDIKSLQQTLGHFWIATTFTYAYDHPSVPADKRVENRIGTLNADRSDDAMTMKAFQEEMLSIRDELDAVAKEILLDNIKKIIFDGAAAGGFTRFIRKLYAHLLLNAEFERQESAVQAQTITDLSFAKGYRIEPLYHGQCHAKRDGNQIIRALCYSKGELHRENASPDRCRKCIFHYTGEEYVQNLREIQIDMEKDANDFLLPPIQQQRARQEVDAIKRVIELNHETMEENKLAIEILLRRNSK